jgi:hypothetical protein
MLNKAAYKNKNITYRYLIKDYNAIQCSETSVLTRCMDEGVHSRP